jgi:hypothetical protein
MARELEQAITPGTIVIAGLGGGYEPGKFLYLTLDHLASARNRPNIYIPISNNELSRFLANPRVESVQIPMSLPYTWTKLDKQVEETLAVKEWKNLTIFIVDTIHNAPQNEESVALAKTLCPAPVMRKIESSANSAEWKMLSILSVTCPIANLTRPLVITPST